MPEKGKTENIYFLLIKEFCDLRKIRGEEFEMGFKRKQR